MESGVRIEKTKKELNRRKKTKKEVSMPKKNKKRTEPQKCATLQIKDKTL